MKSSWNSEKIIAFILGLQFFPILLAILYIVFPFWRFLFSSESQVSSSCFLLFLLLYISHFETFLRIINMRVEGFHITEGLKRPVALQSDQPGSVSVLAIQMVTKFPCSGPGTDTLPRSNFVLCLFLLPFVVMTRSFPTPLALGAQRFLAVVLAGVTCPVVGCAHSFHCRLAPS